MSRGKGNQYWLVFVVAVSCLGASPPTVTRIESAFLEGDAERAGRIARQALAEEDDEAIRDTLEYYWGLSRLRLGDYQEAKRIFRSLMKRSGIDPVLGDKVRLGLVDAAYFTGDYAFGLKTARELIRRRRDSPALSLAYLKAGRAALRLADWKAARRYLREVLRRFPDSLEAETARRLLEEKSYFAVQVGSFLDERRARRFVEELQKQGEYAYIVDTMDGRGRHFYRVRIGRFSRLAEARETEARLAGRGYPTLIYP